MLLIAVVAVVAMMAVLIFSLTANLRWEEEWLVGGSTVKREEFEPAGIRVLPYPYTYALEDANDQLDEMKLGNNTTIDPNSNEFDARLILDYQQGSIMYWRFDDGNVRVLFDAYSGEIIAYTRTPSRYEGNMTEEEATDLANRIMEQFAPIPDDSTGTTATKYPIYDTHTWLHRYWRIVDGVYIDDTMFVRLGEDGTLLEYHKEWWMDLEDADSSYTITKEEAMVTAMETFGDDLKIFSCEKRVVRPNNAFGDQTYYSTPPMYVWEVVMYEGEFPSVVAHIHPRIEDTVVGGKSYQ